MILFLLFILWFLPKNVVCLHNVDYFPDSHPNSNYLTGNYPTINVVSLTQRGYLQFLRYVVDVPPLHEFTFCIWVKSANFTYPQPLFSYSKDEEERLVRAWISPQGLHINLEILGVAVFSFPAFLRPHHWNHVCQAWSSYQGAWALYINGKLAIHGFEARLSGMAIKGGGDIVVGQEYTDFDKGYEDGIEGDVFGFNLVHAFTSVTTLPHPEFPTNSIHFARKRNARQKRGILDIFRSMINFFSPPPQRLVSIEEFNEEQDRRMGVMTRSVVGAPKANNRILSGEHLGRPLGLDLVEMGYDCLLGRGAPLKGEKVLVSWTKTTVRVFGGAILKPEIPFCLRKSEAYANCH